MSSQKVYFSAKKRKGSIEYLTPCITLNGKGKREVQYSNNHMVRTGLRFVSRALMWSNVNSKIFIIDQRESKRQYAR